MIRGLIKRGIMAVLSGLFLLIIAASFVMCWVVILHG